MGERNQMLLSVDAYLRGYRDAAKTGDNESAALFAILAKKTMATIRKKWPVPRAT